MDVTVTYEEALARHPDAVRAITTKIKKGKSKEKDSDPATWDWSYSWGTMVEGSTSLADLLSGKHEPWHVKQARMTLDERVADEVRRSKPVHLVAATKPRHKTRGYETLDKDYFPPEAEKSIRAGHRERMRDEARYAAMSQEERDAEVRGALEFLTGPRNKGFVAVRVAPSPEIEGTLDSETWSATTSREPKNRGSWSQES